jgi:hypothetical protein
MQRRLIVTFFLLAAVVLPTTFQTGGTILAGDECANAAAAFTSAINRCENMGYNRACYGRSSVAADLRSPAYSTSDFNQPGESLDLDAFDSISTRQAGVSVMVLKELYSVAVKLVFFGETSVDSGGFEGSPPAIEVAGYGEESCNDLPAGVLALTTGGTASVIVNDVLIELGSSVLIIPQGGSACLGSPPARMSPDNMPARVTFTDGRPLNIRNEPGGTQIDQMPEGEAFTVIGGPRCAALGGRMFTWWQIRSADGRVGWSAEGGDEFYYMEPRPGAATVQRGDWMSLYHVEGTVRYGAVNARTLATLPSGQFLLVDHSQARPRFYGPFSDATATARNPLLRTVRDTLDNMAPVTIF